MSRPKERPSWVPKDAGAEFTTHVSAGIKDVKTQMPTHNKKLPTNKAFSAAEYANGILGGNRMLLSRAITIIESNAEKHFELGQEILRLLLPHTGGAVRVGITGVPGAGKSTFVDALGTHLCEVHKKRVAVLAVDPSSAVTRGSILGDKVRMERLARCENAFIRPSPTGGTLGGVARKSRETLLLCEAAGFDVLLLETVGVGQSETLVRSMVDFFMVLALTGAGDELQGIKKGVMETADAIVVNKADGDNLQKAQTARSEYEQILHYLRPATPGWVTAAYTASAREGTGIEELWHVILRFVEATHTSGVFAQRREEQTLSWVHSTAKEQIDKFIYQNPQVQAALQAIEAELQAGSLSPSAAARAMTAAIQKELFIPH